MAFLNLYILFFNPDEVPEKTTPEKKQEEKPVEEKEVDDDLDFTLDETEVMDPTQPITTAQLLARRQAILNKRRFHIGILCSAIIETPEEKVYV